MGTTYLPHRDWTNVPFASAQCPVHEINSASLFLPQGAQPDAGFALKIIFQLSAFASTSLPSSIGDAQKEFQHWLDTGHALLFVQLPVSRGGSTGNATSDASFNTGSGLYGAAYPGNGCLQAPGTAHFLDPAYFNAIKSGAMSIQWAVWTAQTGGLPIDPTKISLYGRSAGGIIAAYLYWSKDLAPLMFPGGAGQDAISTRTPKHAHCDSTATWFPIFDLDGLPALDPDTGAGVDFHAFMFATAASGSAANVPCNTMNQASLSVRQALSPLIVGQDSAVDAENKASRPIYMTSAGLGTAGAPYGTTNPNITSGVQGAAEQHAHSIWGAAAARTYFGSQVKCVQTGTLLPSSGLEDATFDLAVAGQDDLLYADETAHMDAALDYTWPPEETEPVEELALRAIEDEIRTVTTVNGYLTDVALVFRGEEMADELRQYPAVMTTAIDASYSDREFHPKVYGSAGVTLTLVLKSRDVAATRRTLVSRFIADVRKALQLRLETDGFAGLLTNLHVERSRRWLNDNLATPICGAVLDLRVEFRDLHADPYTPA